MSDVLAIVLPVLAAVLAVIAGLISLRWRPAIAVAVSILLAGTVATVLPWLPAPTGPVNPAASMTIAGSNIGVGELDGATELLNLQADILVVSEIGPPLTERLRPFYPHSFSEWPGPAIAVFSRYPFTILERPSADLPGVRLHVDGLAGPFVVEALHVPRPWWRMGSNSYETTVADHHRLLELAVKRAANEQLPVVVVGDLNSTDRGRDYRDLLDRGRLTDAMLDSWGAPTQIGKWSPLLIRIDHILVSDGWCAEDSRQYAVPASDHRGIAVHVGPCATAS